MAARALYARVGLLILVGLLLAVGFVLFLTAGRLSSTAQVMETYVSESVQGLDVGAPVRYRGVQVGRVTELGLVSSAYRRPNNVPFGVSFQLVLVRFAIDLSQVGNESVPGIEEAVRLGLRARITAQGITGVNYVELDFLNPERFPALRIPWQPQYPYVPAAPSTVAQVRNAAEDLVGRLAQLPLDSILTDLAGIVSNLNTQTREADLASVLLEVRQLAAEVRQAVAGSDLPAAIQDFRTLAADAHRLLDGRETRSALSNISSAVAELRQTVARLPPTVQALEGTLRAARGTTTDAQSELAPILRDLRSATSNLRDTTELLRRAPSQALFGAPPPPPERSR